MLILTLLEQLGPVHLQQVHLLTHVVDVPIDHDKCLLVLVLALDIDLYQQLPSLFLLSQLNGMLSGRVLLSANLNGSVNIENWRFCRVLNSQEFLNFRLLVLLHVTVQ